MKRLLVRVFLSTTCLLFGAFACKTFAPKAVMPVLPPFIRSGELVSKQGTSGTVLIEHWNISTAPQRCLTMLESELPAIHEWRKTTREESTVLWWLSRDSRQMIMIRVDAGRWRLVESTDDGFGRANSVRLEKSSEGSGILIMTGEASERARSQFAIGRRLASD